MSKMPGRVLKVPALLFLALLIGSDCSVDSGGTALAAAFDYVPSSPTVNETVQFTDTSTGHPSAWQWDFNDGSSSTAQNPSHPFASSGSYAVSLTVGDGSKTSSVNHVVTVSATAAFQALFVFSPSSPEAGEAVQFTDTSAGGPTSWSWTFGDGGTSTLQNPVHPFAAAGTYTVTLTVTKSGDSSQTSHVVEVAAASGIIPASRRINWSYCGVPGGVPARTTVYRALSPGATAAQINAAIAACPSGQVVTLSAGTYNNIGAINFGSKNGVTLRGAGAGQTIVNSTVSGGDYSVTSDYLGFTGAATISSGYTRGSTSLVMAATPTNFAVGKLIAVTENDDTSLVMATDGPGQNLKTIHKITAKSGNTLTISPPLPYTLSGSLSPKAAYCAGTGATLCGLEDLTINNNGGVNAIIAFSNADRCWIKGVETYNADNIFIWIYESFQCEIRRSYCSHAKGSPNNPDGYGVYLYEGSSYCLVEDNIFYELAAGCLQSRASCNAFLYNYGWKTTFNNAAWQFCMLNCNHGAHDMMDLWEGNMAEQWQNDGYHGSGSHQTLFRNWFHGLHPTATTNRKMIDICRAGYYHNIVGNVLGAASWNPVVYEMTGQQDYSQSCIYRLGYANMTDNDYAPAVAWPSTYGLTYPDARVKSTLLRHGNYDYYNKATQWDAAIADHTLPASLYYSSKPAYFGSLQWPPIGPDVAGYVTDIPAKVRWETYQTSGNKRDLF
jgi:PKD repeat protein